MLLFNSQVSGNCYKVRLLLAHLGLSYDRREVDGWLERVAGQAGHVNITA